MTYTRLLIAGTCLLASAVSVHAQTDEADDCPEPLSVAVVEATCGATGLEVDRLKADDEDCNWVYVRPDDETRLLSVLRTTTSSSGEGDLMNQLSGMMGQGSNTQRDIPDLGEGGQAHTASVPMMMTAHTVTFSQGGAFFEVKASGGADPLAPGTVSEPFCTLKDVEALARHVAAAR